jgi:hypothetical protein
MDLGARPIAYIMANAFDFAHRILSEHLKQVRVGMAALLHKCYGWLTSFTNFMKSLEFEAPRHPKRR